MMRKSQQVLSSTAASSAAASINRNHLLAMLAQRAGHVRLFRAVPQDALMCMQSLLQLRIISGGMQHTMEEDRALLSHISASFVKLCRLDASQVADVLQSAKLNPQDPADGRGVALLAYALPKVNSDEAIWELLTPLCEAGLHHGVWHPSDLRTILYQISLWGAYPPSLIKAVEAHVASRVRTCSQLELVMFSQYLGHFHELHRSSLMHDIATRFVAIADSASASTISSIALQLYRVRYHENSRSREVGEALSRQGVRFAEDCDGFGAANLFNFLVGFASTSFASTTAAASTGSAASSGSATTTAASGWRWWDTDVMRCLCERLMDAEGLDESTVLHLCKAVRRFPHSHRDAFRSDLTLVVEMLSREVLWFLQTPKSAGGLLDGNDASSSSEASLNALQMMAGRFIGAVTATVKHTPKTVNQSSAEGNDNTVFSDDVNAALSAVAAAVSSRVETLVSSENPPFSLIPHLLGCPHKAVQSAAFALLHEASLQKLSFPTVQAYRFLLDLGDHPLFADRTVFRHLRNQFAQTVKGIPPMQMCAALKCFVRGLTGLETALTGTFAAVEKAPRDAKGDDDESWVEGQVEMELEREDMMAFLTQCQETIQQSLSIGLDIRAVLSLTASMFVLECRDHAFFAQLQSYLATKVPFASPNLHSKDDAKVCLEVFSKFGLVEGAAESSGAVAKVKQFLDTVMAEGVHDADLLPSAWMDLYDPSNHIIPLTDEQERGWQLLEQMRHTRSADTANLTRLATDYVAMLRMHRPDDIRQLFVVCEEKVFKNDKLLKQALDHLCELDIVTKFAGSTIASILHSLGAIRFSYYATVKRFLLAVSEEQWATLDAAVLVQIVSGMSKLSLRLPGVLLQIGERLAAICKFMTPMDTAILINSFQSLGFHDDVVLNMLMQHAGKSASRFDEVALTVLFGSSTIHRLMTSAESSVPLLEKAARSPGLSGGSRQKIVAALRKCSLPRDLIQSSVARVCPELVGGDGQPRLRIGAE